MKPPRARTRSGFTVIELLAVIGIVALLFSLLLPAIQAARESARRATCSHHQKQLILATHAFETSQSGFPRASRLNWLPDRTTNQMSLHCELLSYLEQNTLYQSINFDLPCAIETQISPNHSTAAAVCVDVFLCPSDSQRAMLPYSPNNYRANVGLGEFIVSPYGSGTALSYDQSGAFAYTKQLPLSSFTDGLSNTVAFSEKLIGSGRGGRYNPARDWVPTSVSGAITANEWVSLCSNLGLEEGVSARSDSGKTWILSGAIYTDFFLSTTPNSSVPDCGRETFLGVGVFGARSFHPGGVNAAFADGSCRWISSGIDLQIWRSLGTRGCGD